MEIKQQSKLKFNGVDIINVNFTSQQAFKQGENINLDIQPKVYFPKEHPMEFRIGMEVSLKCPNYFDLFLVAIGYFVSETELGEVERKAFVNHNAPAIMFPYVRAFISTFTSNLGHTTGMLSIPPHFFKGDIEVVQESDINPDLNPIPNDIK